MKDEVALFKKINSLFRTSNSSILRFNNISDIAEFLIAKFSFNLFLFVTLICIAIVNSMHSLTFFDIFKFFDQNYWRESGVLQEVNMAKVFLVATLIFYFLVNKYKSVLKRKSLKCKFPLKLQWKILKEKKPEHEISNYYSCLVYYERFLSKNGNPELLKEHLFFKNEVETFSEIQSAYYRNKEDKRFHSVKLQIEQFERKQKENGFLIDEAFNVTFK